MIERGKYYYKSELIQIAKQNGFKVSGLSKTDIENMLKNNIQIEIIQKTKVVGDIDYSLRLENIIHPNFKISYEARDFFSKFIPNFKTNIRFNAWLKKNRGHKTYKDAIEVFFILKDLKNETIAPQFQYMQYIRDFFKNNPQGKRSDAIKCWLWKKSLNGNKIYEKSDLDILL